MKSDQRNEMVAGGKGVKGGMPFDMASNYNMCMLIEIM